MSKKFKSTRALLGLCCLLALANASCAIFSFEELCASVSVGEAENFYAEEFVAINFSLPVNQALVENGLVVKEDGKSCEAEFSWNGNSCLVRAAGGYKKGFKYGLSLNGAVLTNDGRSYSVSIFREFIFGLESELFFAKTVEEPKANEGRGAPLAFVFNKPVDPAVFEREFSVSPSLELKKEFLDKNERVEIYPADKWKANTVYEWKLCGARSLDGAKLCKECSGSFMACRKEAAPKVLCVCPVSESGVFEQGEDLSFLCGKASLGIIFDSEMNFESLKKGAFWSPAVQGYWTKVDGSRFVWTPCENYKLQTEHSLVLSESIEDEFGLALGERRVASFTPRLDFIRLRAFCPSKAGQGAGGFENVELKKDELNWILLPEESSLIVTLDFSKPLDKKSVQAAKTSASLSPHFPASAKSANLDSIVADKGGGFQIQFEWSGFEFSEGLDERVYLLKAKGGENFFYGQFGEYLKEDECFYIAIKKS